MDPWLPQLLCFRVFSPPVLQLGSKVSELFLPSQSWDEYEIIDTFSPYEANLITIIKLANGPSLNKYLSF